MTNAGLNLPKTKTSRPRNPDTANGKGSPGISGETAHDILRTHERPLDSIFSTKIVAVIGATERKRIGRTIMTNLLQGEFPGTIYPVNPIQELVLGLKAYPNVSSLPEKTDLAVIITPPATVPGIVKECVDVGVRGAIIISADFKEIGAAGAALEQQVLTEARRGELLRRLIQIGRDEKLTRLKAVILADNRTMLHLSKKARFKVQHESGGHDFTAEFVY